MAVAKAYGAKKIIVFDVEESRVNFAKAYCADVGILSPRVTKAEEPMAFASKFIQTVLKENGLEDGVDIAIEASGAETCMQMAVVAAKPGATSKYNIVFAICAVY